MSKLHVETPKKPLAPQNSYRLSNGDSTKVNGKKRVFGFFERGREHESRHINHIYTDAEIEHMHKVQSIDYLPQNSFVYRTWLRNEGKPNSCCAWSMYGLVGASVGVLGFLVKNLVFVLSRVRMDLIEHELEEVEPGAFPLTAWLVAVGIAVAFALVSTLVVVFWEPMAAGSGLPEVIAYLNGTRIRYIFSFKTGVAKFISVVFSVASGLPVGPEGPMVHLGALIGKGISQGRLQGSVDTKKMSRTCCSQFQTAEQRRNFLSAGAAAGIAAAFGAPVGGTLFAMEEVASYWNTALTWQIFFCSMCSTFTANLLTTAFKGFQSRSAFGLFSAHEGILFEVEKKMPVNLFMVPAAFVIGLVCGLFAVVFTFFNLKFSRCRNKYIRPKKWARVLEVIVLAIVMATVGVLVPNLFPCTQTCSEQSQNCLTTDRTPHYIKARLPNFGCTEPTVTVNGTVSAEKLEEMKKQTRVYNEVATLLLLPGEEAVEHLFSRETPNEFRYASLLTLLAIYFPLSMYTAGTAISSGIVVPILMTGACIGRIFGQGFWDVFVNSAVLPENLIDPGAFALIGAAAFFGGVSRLTVSLTVIMMEITNDGAYLLPIMVSTITSKFVADYFTHSLYHSLIEVKAIPFVDTAPTYGKSLDLYKICEIMVSPVAFLSVTPEINEIVDILMSNSHGAYPIVDNSDGGALYRGTVTRLHLISILEHLQDTGFASVETAKVTKRGTLIDIQTNASNDKYIHYNVLEKLHENNPIYKDGTVLTAFLLEMRNSVCAHTLFDLRPYCNYSAPSVPQEMSLHRSFVLFRALGLRHLVIVNKYNFVVGIVTRKDFMGFKVEEKLNKSGEERYFEPNPLVDIELTPSKMSSGGSARSQSSTKGASTATLLSMEMNLRSRGKK